MSASKSLSGVIKRLLICSMTISTSLGLNLALAQSETAESTPASPMVIQLPGFNTPSPRRTRYNFTAAEYFYPIRPGVDRTHLPERLTFEVNRNITLDELESQLSAQTWKYVFHCGGRAISVDDFRRDSLLDGVINQSTTNQFSFNGDQGVLNQTLHAPEINTRNIPDTETRSFNISRIENLGNGEFRVFGDFQPRVYSILNVRETGEVLIQMDI